MKNPYSLTFGSKTYDGSAEKTITASDLGALTEHQSLAGYATEANTPYAGTGNTTDLQAYLKANRSFIGSVISNSVWQNILSIRHRNGADDGNAYGMYFRAALTTIGSLVWNKEMNGTWQGERTILDTTNYTDYTYSKASVDSYLAGKQDVISDLAAIRSGAALGATALQSHQSVTNTGNTLSFGSAVIIGSVGGTNLTAALPSVASVKSTLGLGSLAFLNSLGKADVGLGNVENTALSTWAGTSKITTLGTITSGTWNGSKIANTYLANSAITIAGTSVSLGGSITAATITAAQIGSGNTLLHSGNIGSYNAGSATKLQTARTIWGQSFDGTGNVSGALSGVTNINGAITINSSSNVGIGTTSPAYKLDVNGTARVSGATTLSSTLTAHNHLILYQSDDAYRMTFNEQDNIGRIYNITADGNAYGDMYIGSNLANAIVVKGGSYVGVGMVPSGDYKLEVYGAVKSTSVTTSLVRSSGGLDIVAHNSSAGSRLWLTTGTFRPWGDDNGKIDLGASSIRWKGLYCGTGDFSGAVTMSSTLSVSDSATLGGGELTIGNANSCIIKLARGGACYIWATTAGGYYSFGVQDKGSTTIANASLSIYANVLTPGARNKEVDLGSKNCRWNNVYAHGGNFSGEMTVGGILTVGGTSTFNGDVRINGNLVVTGDTASGGTGTISAGGYGPVEIDTNTLMYGGLDGKSDIPQSTMDALGLTQDVVENLINGLYTKVVYKGSDDGHVWTYDADTYGTTKYIYLHTGDGAQSRISIQLTYNGSTWSSYFSSI